MTATGSIHELTTTSNPHAFLRVHILNFQVHNQPAIDLETVRTQIELKEKHRRSSNDQIEKPARKKFPMFVEKDRCIPFDAGLLKNVKRQIIIRIHANNVTYTFDSDLNVLRKLADGHRHRFSFSPRAQAEMIIRYKDANGRTVPDPLINGHAGRFAERRQQVYKHFGHEFVSKVFKLPIFCSVCRNFLWGFASQGYQCQRCDCVVHRTCYNRYACPCTGRRYPDSQTGAAHHFLQQSFSLKPLFCDHCGSFIRPGHVHKCSDCSMTVHRRCTEKVGNYCGCEENNSALYEEWKRTHDYESSEYYQYNGDLYELYRTFQESNEGRENELQRFSINRRVLKKSSFDINQFRLLRSLGQGMNGSVYLAEYGRNFYAMKVLRKNVVLEGQDVAYVMLEREILIQCASCPFIIDLIYTFQNEERLFFLMEVARGGNFYRLLVKQAPKPFRYERIVFHIGEIVCALSFLHSKRIAYRDLKPENVLVFEDGHIKLGDFGLCKRDVDKSPRAATFCGTPEYIAYEIYRHCEYDENVDWWSLGVMIYEFFTFTTPFFDDDENQIQENVLYGEVNYPSSIPSAAKQIIAALLERDPKKRLGNVNSPHGSFTDQPFFSEPFTLDKIEHRQIPPPWIPLATSLIPLESIDEEIRLSQIEHKDRLLLLSALPETFNGFSYVNPQAITRF